MCPSRTREGCVSKRKARIAVGRMSLGRLPTTLAGLALFFGLIAMAAPVFLPVILDQRLQEVVHSILAGSDPLERMEDGSARWPAMFREFIRRNETLLQGLAEEDAQWPEVVKGDDLDKFQDMLRAAKQETDEHREAIESAKRRIEERIDRNLEACLRRGKRPPHKCEQVADNARLRNNPKIRRMKMMGPLPTEDDAYNQHAPEVPAHMRCDACRAVSWQAALSVTSALAKRKQDDKVSVLTIEALETTCHNLSLWMYDYGYAPGPTGVNVFVGPGVAGRENNAPPQWNERNGDTIVPQVQHSDGIGRRLSSACQAMLLSESPDEEQVARAVLAAGVEASAASEAAAALRKLACEQPGQPCA